MSHVKARPPRGLVLPGEYREAKQREHALQATGAKKGAKIVDQNTLGLVSQNLKHDLLPKETWLRTEGDMVTLVAAMRMDERKALHALAKESTKKFGDNGCVRFAWQGRVFNADAELAWITVEAIGDVQQKQALVQTRAAAPRREDA